MDIKGCIGTIELPEVTEMRMNKRASMADLSCSESQNQTPILERLTTSQLY